MEKLSRTDIANIKRLDAVAEKPRKKKRILDKKILELQAELFVVDGEIKFWEEQIEKISGVSYAETMAYINNKGIEEPQVEEESINSIEETKQEDIF